MSSTKTNTLAGMPLTEMSVFIIEALPETDHTNGFCDGKVLYDQLLMTPQKPQYVSVANKKEFVDALKRFKNSHCRFLHMSFHGEENGSVFLVGKERVNYEELAGMLSGCLTNNRLTLSTCYAGCGRLFEAMIKKNKGSIHSVLGFRTEVSVADSSAFWVAYYTLITRLTYPNPKGTNNYDHIQTAGLAKIIERVGCLLRLKLRFCYLSNKKGRWELCDESFSPKPSYWRNMKTYPL